MKKILSILIIMIMLLISMFVLTGCGKEENTNYIDNKSNVNNNNNNLEIGKYRVEKGNDYVAIINNTGTAISTTKYIFENDVLSKIETVQKISSKDLAKSTYDNMVTSDFITQQYSIIELLGDTIMLVSKPEMVELLKDFSLEDLYQQQYDIYKSLM